MTQITNTYDYGPVSGGKPEQLVIFLHGVGANGQDLISLAPLLGQALPDAVFVSPDAPFECDMAPVGFQWFSLQNRDPHILLQGVQRTAPILDSYIKEQCEKYNIPASKTALLGFSQGTMMSLYVGPRYPEPLAGIMGYSGALIWESDIPGDSLHKLPVHLIHGEADNVVLVDAYHNARALLEKHGFPVSGHTTPGLMHGIDEQGISEGARFLVSILR